MNIKGVISAFSIAALFGLLLVLYFYPSIPRSITGWLALFLLGLPTWFFMELIGVYVFQSNFFKSMPSALRVIIAVPIVIVLFIAAIYIGKHVHVVIEYFGG